MKKQSDADSQWIDLLLSVGGFVLTALLGGCADPEKTSATEPSTATENADTIVHCGILIDGLTDRPLPHQSISIHSGRIVSVAPTSDLSSHSGD
ncbi:MAG: hypothetical protein VW039_10150, partial [Halieaceae bacterium]